MPPKGIFNIFDEDALENNTDLELYLKSVRDILVEKKDPYYTLCKSKIKELISEPDKMVTKEYKEKMIPRLTMVKDNFGSEYLKTLIEIFSEVVLHDKRFISKQGLLFLNKVWKDKI